MRFTLRTLMMGVFLLCVSMSLLWWFHFSCPPISWREYSGAALKKALENNRPVAALFEGRAGGNHQYIVVDKVFASRKVRRLMKSKRVAPLSADFRRLYNLESCNAGLTAVGLDRQAVPVVVFYTRDGETIIVEDFSDDTAIVAALRRLG